MERSHMDLFEALELCGCDDEKKALIGSLLHSPWKCKNELVERYIDSKLAKIILTFKNSVLYHVVNERSHYRHSTFVDHLVIQTICDQPNSQPTLYPQFYTQTELNFYIELIEEDLDLLKDPDRTWSLLGEYGKASLLGLYLYSSIAVYNVAGIITRRPKTNIFQINPQWKTAFEIKALRSVMNSQSHTSDQMQALKIWPLLEKLIKQGRRVKNSPGLLTLTEGFVDKIFSINPRVIQEASRSRDLKILIDRMQLLVFLWLYALAKAREELKEDPSANIIKGIHDKSYISKDEIIKAGFHEREIDSLVHNGLSSSSEHILEVTQDDKTYGICCLNIKYAAQIHAKELQSPILKEKWFEESYLVPYLKKCLPANRFIIGRRITWKDKEKSDLPGYDVDVIIYDNATRLFYFCQIKHRECGLFIGLRKELKEYRNRNSIQKGIDQLNHLYGIINTSSVKGRIVTAFQDTAIGHAFIKRNDFTLNSRFLLIHNIENFDFCSKNGIAMYEWNTFRNLLQGNMTQISKTHSSGKKYSTDDLDFSDLPAVKNILLAIQSEVDQFNQKQIRSDIKITSITDQLATYHHIRNEYGFWIGNKKIPFYRKKEIVTIPVL